MPNATSSKLAVLFDADNAQASVVKELMAEVAKYGKATVKRAYGDWTTPNLAGWKDVLHDLAIQPIQQFRFTAGKNATDSALIIDAMDILHSGAVDGFCLVSSDSDFTRLARRIGEAGLSVYGFGEKKTPKAFVAACDKFIYTEILRPQAADALQAVPIPADTLKPALVAAIEAVAREDRWAALSGVGSYLNETSPSFDPRNYGFKKLGELVPGQAYLDVKSVPAADGSPISHIFVRMKEG